MNRTLLVVALLALGSFAAGAAVARAGDPMPQPLGELMHNSHEIFLGLQQSGKTTRVRARVSDAFRVVIFSPTDDYVDCGDLVAVEDLEEEPELLRGAVLRLVVIPEDEDVADEFNRLVAVLRAHLPRYGPAILVADEVGDYRDKADKTLRRLCSNGHHKGIASIFVSQRAADIPPACFANASRVVSLLQTREADLDLLAREYGERFAEKARTWRRGREPAIWHQPLMYPEESSC